MVLEAHDLWKSYRGGDGGVVHVLESVEFELRRGEMVAIVGASGAGKSTLLNLLGALDTPTRGRVTLAGEPLAGPSDGVELTPAPRAGRSGVVARWRERRRRRGAMRQSEDRLADLRNEKIGFVFQFHHLLREFSALENVMMPLRIAGVAARAARSRAEELLSLVGLSGRMSHRPAELSGGEQQRTAVARALALDPAVVLADEPSGNLDHANAERLHDLFSSLVRELEVAMVVVTHNRSLASRADRVLLLEDGRLRDTDVREGVT